MIWEKILKTKDVILQELQVIDPGISDVTADGKLIKTSSDLSDDQKAQIMAYVPTTLRAVAECEQSEL